MGKVRLAALVAVVCLSFGCVTYSAPVMPPAGFLFASIEAPIDTDAQATPVGARRGESTSYSILSLIAFGDASVQAAAAAGGLVKVEHVDYEYLNVLLFFQSFTTVVYGE